MIKILLIFCPFLKYYHLKNLLDVAKDPKELNEMSNSKTSANCFILNLYTETLSSSISECHCDMLEEGPVKKTLSRKGSSRVVSSSKGETQLCKDTTGMLLQKTVPVGHNNQERSLRGTES